MALFSIVYNHYQTIVDHDRFFARHVERFIYHFLVAEVGQYVPCMPYSQDEFVPVQTLASIRTEVQRLRAITVTSKTTRLYKRTTVAAYQEFLDLYATGNKPAWYVHAQDWQKVLLNS